MTHPARQVTTADVNPMAELWWSGWHEAHAAYVPEGLIKQRTLKSFRSRLQTLGDNVRVAGPVGAPVGLCAIKDDELYQLFVAPSVRGTGIATALLTDGERRLASQGVKRASLYCLPENRPAVRFYLRHGWEDRGVAREIFHGSDGGFPLDAIRFEKDLTPG